MSLIISVDFDGTLFEHRYPEIGRELTGAFDKLKYWQSKGVLIILNTMRSGETLQQAVDAIQARGIKLFGINDNPTQSSWTSSRKIYSHVYIDDAAYGCPLIYPIDGRRPYVDWSKIELDLGD